MRTFGYARPTTTDEALGLLTRPGAQVLAGGTNLVDLMKLGVANPDVLVDVTGLDLAAITALPGGGLRVGATVRNSDLAAHPSVRRDLPVLSQALLAGASGQVRNQATLAGNLLQRTRCAYFQDPTKPCNKRSPGTGCPAIQGEHHNLAVLGHSSSCVATNPSDLAVALSALDARVIVRERADAGGSDGAGERAVPLDEFYRLPGDEPQHDTTLPDGALILAVEIPGLPVGAVSRYRKARERASYAFASASVAVALDLDGDVVRDARVAFGALAHAPWRARRAEDALRGRPVTAATVAAAADAELSAARPLRDNGYKVPLARNLFVSVATELAEVTA